MPADQAPCKRLVDLVHSSSIQQVSGDPTVLGIGLALGPQRGRWRTQALTCGSWCSVGVWTTNGKGACVVCCRD